MKRYFSLFFLTLSLGVCDCKALDDLDRGNGAEPDSLNIHQAQGINAHNILRDLYEGLMTVDAHGQPVYGVASDHQVSGNTWTFTLKKEAKWSDGTAVTAHDFVRAWHMAIDPKSAAPYAFLMDNIMHAKKIMQLKLPPNKLMVKAIDNHTLSIQLWQPDSSFLEKLTLPIFFPLPPQNNAKQKQRIIISNGPYQLHQWNIQEKVVLTANPHYYQPEDLYFSKVTYWVTDDQSSELKRFRADELDITESIPDSQIDWIKQHLNDELRIAPYLGSFFLGLNLKDKHLKNRHLRRALSLAIDRDILTQKVLKSGQIPAYGIVPQALLGNSNNTKLYGDEKSTMTQRIKQAKAALIASDIKKHDLIIEILYNSSDNQRKVALAIAAMWRQNLGIRSRLVNQEWKVFVQSRRSDQRQAFRSGWIADYAEAMSFLSLFTSNSDFNFYRYQNINYDSIINKISKTQDRKTKKQLIQQAEKLLMHDIPVIPLYYYVSRHLVKTDILGFKNNVTDRHLSKYLYKRGR